MQNSTYTIYNASAGSGKTFTIAKSYIKLLVKAKNHDQFKSILAITFTNKAVGEMKERVIEMLKLFSSEKSLKEPHVMFIAICEELAIAPDYLHNKSKSILKHIIHNYGAFNISTIDGFTHRVIRTFAHDLKLPVNFEVELDQERLLNEAVDSLISKAGANKELTDILVDFAIEKTDDDKSWDISYDFNKVAKLLISENDLPAIEALKEKTLNDFKQLKLELGKTIVTTENEIVNIAKSVLTLIDECGLQFDDFNRKSLPNHFRNISVKKFDINFEASWQNDLVEGNLLYPKRVTDTIASTIESIHPQLAEAYEESKTLVFQLKLKKGFYKNITPLSVLNAIQNELNLLKEEQNKMLISEFNKIISKEIKNQPTPFIYERLGEKYKHYFIDEFQDTSKMQWENLIPLLDNALSAADGSTMLVGDAKQAIYRWRGGDAKQFINLFNKSENPFQIEAEVLSLDTNYRSTKTIIDFNNTFFNFLSERYFSNANYSNLYKTAKQQVNINTEGYVNLKFLDLQKNDDTDEIYALHVLNTIENCLQKGYTLDNICVLVRKRKEGVTIANYLSENGINITSSETLLLINSDKVNFLDTFLKLLIQPTNDNLKIEVLSFLANQHAIKDKHLFFSTHLEPNLDDMLNSLSAIHINIAKEELLRLPLYELVEHLIRTFDFCNKSDAYIQFYLDVVMEFSQKQNSDLAAFVNYFEKKKDSLSIISPEDINAVKIMTIHKSKGLEFPIVIFPYAELNIYKELDPKIWFPVPKNDTINFKKLLLNYSKNVAHFGDIGEQIYSEHQSQQELDNINLLYVVLTRAVEQLYIISKKDINSKGEVNDKTYSGMFISYLQHISRWSENQLEYTFGKLVSNQKQIRLKEVIEPLQLISVPKENHGLSVISKAGLLWDTKQEKAIERGNLVHLVLSKIKTKEDIAFAFNDLVISGELTEKQILELKTLVISVIDHPKLNSYYTGEYKIFNERDIITPQGQILRPDRLNISSNNEVIIIDYKTGDMKASYKSQLNMYAAVLKDMDYEVIHKYIVYINDSVEVIEV